MTIVTAERRGTAYEDFLKSKILRAPPSGFDVAKKDVHPRLFAFQKDVVQWAAQRGKAAIFADCGMGKTLMQLEWARIVRDHTRKPVLIFAPLAVSTQTIREAKNIGLNVTPAREQADLDPDGISITNYEMLHKFSPDGLAGIVLDESSILKGYDGMYRRLLTEFASGLPYRLACTATPAPNDLMELSRHAEFLGIMREKEVAAMFFIQDGNNSSKWRLKKHARQDFWRWLASWSVAMRAPSDLGYDDGDFLLPDLTVEEHVIEADTTDTGLLFAVEASGLLERRQARRDSLEDRVEAAARLANSSNESWLIWCDLNAESQALTKAIPDAVEITGSDSPEEKERRMIAFADGEIRVLVTKPTIAGFGMNWQHCHNVVFVGLSDSYEQYYQAVRRCWRFGQTQDVTAHVVISDREGAVVENIRRKEQQASEMFSEIVRHMRGLSLGKAERVDMTYRESVETGEGWTLRLGDSVETIDDIKTESVGLSVFSPPFPGMYAYTNSPRDMGNVKDIEEMIAQFRFLMGPEKMLRVVKPGRSACVHLTQIPTSKHMDGFTGLRDFRGDVIRMMQDEGWIYYGEVCIDKNPQIKAIRTKDHGLMFKTLAKDSSKMHMALADYILQFKKPGENQDPIRSGKIERYNNLDGWITAEEWIEWAAPVWYRKSPDYPGGIDETDVLPYQRARGEDDEKHLCPLQLGVIERCVKLWSAPGELVYSPFAGIGSEGYVSLKLQRRFVGGELKPSYFEVAVENLKRAEVGGVQAPLFAAQSA